MNIQIDQSGKVERTNQDTILAFSNGKSSAVRITGKTKRRLQEKFRENGEPRLFMIGTFCALIFLVIKDNIKEIDLIEIDKEYPGKEQYIISTLKKFSQNKSINLPVISFISIGKKSKAHQKAIEVFRKKSQPDKIITLKEIMNIVSDNKNRRPEVCRKRL